MDGRVVGVPIYQVRGAEEEVGRRFLGEQGLSGLYKLVPSHLVSSLFPAEG